MIDLTDSKWQELHFLIEQNQFYRWIFYTLNWGQYGKDKIKQYLFAYQELTGESFFRLFWNKKDDGLHSIFSKLAELELICPLDLLEEYLTEFRSDREQADEKWKIMAGYLKTYMEGLQTPKAAEMLFRIAEEIGISDEGLFAVEALLLESVRMVPERRSEKGIPGNFRDRPEKGDGEPAENISDRG